MSDKLIDDESLRELRELACRHTGLTMAELLEQEANTRRESSPIAIDIPYARLARSRMQRASVPERYIVHVADNQPAQCQAIRSVKSWLASTDSMLVLAGGPGVRKTGSASWAITQFERGAEFVEADALIAIKLDDAERWARIWDAQIVILDDLGTERKDKQDVWLDTFTRLFQRLYSSSKRLVITTNLTPEQFRAEYGERIYDRLVEGGPWVNVEGESVRGGNHWQDDSDEKEWP